MPHPGRAAEPAWEPLGPRDQESCREAPEALREVWAEETTKVQYLIPGVKNNGDDMAAGGLSLQCDFWERQQMGPQKTSSPLLNYRAAFAYKLHTSLVHLKPSVDDIAYMPTKHL